MLERIVYVSKAREGVDARDAYEIIRVSHNRNSRCGLTGALIMLDGHFLQVLEGDGFHINQRLAAIQKDPRHHDVELRERAAIAEPVFPDEWMALRLADGVSEAVKTEFDYEPGFPADRFDASQLVAFAQACCAPAGN
jgi:Sensors of blue-light using FAD